MNSAAAPEPEVERPCLHQEPCRCDVHVEVAKLTHAANEAATASQKTTESIKENVAAVGKVMEAIKRKEDSGKFNLPARRAK